MTLSEVCIRRPVMTTLITASFIVFGAFAYRLLPVSALPQASISRPSRSWHAARRRSRRRWRRRWRRRSSGSSRPSPASASMTSSSSLGTTPITIQFDLNRDIDAAALDVQTALTIAQRRLPVEMTTPPGFRKVNPGEFPILFIAIISPTLPLSTVHEYADTIAQQDLAAARRRPGADLRRAEIRRARAGRSGGGGRARHLARGRAQRGRARPTPACRSARCPVRSRTSSCRPPAQLERAAEYRHVVVAWRNGMPIKLDRDRPRHRQRRERQDRQLVQRQSRDRAGDPAPARCQYGRGRRPGARQAAELPRAGPGIDRHASPDGPVGPDPPIGDRRAGDLGHRHRARRHGDLPVPALGRRNDHSGAGGADLARRHLRGDVCVRILDQQHDACWH